MYLQEQVGKLYATLNEELNEFSYGERFYSFRELMERFKTNKRVISATLEKMETAGLITRASRVGIFVNVMRRKASRSLLLALPDFPSEGNRILVENIRAEVYRRGNYQLQVQLMEPNFNLVKWKENKTFDALLLVYPALNGMKKEYLNCLLEKNLPVILLGWPPTALPFCSLAGDDIQAGMLACHYLIRHGCKKLAVVIGEPYVPEIAMRLHAFCTFAEVQGIPVRQIHAYSDLAESSSYKAHDTLSRDLRKNGVTFDGLFVLCDAAVPGVYQALAEWGLRVPDDISVIGHDGNADGAFFVPPITTIAHDEKLRCKILFDKLDDLLDGKIGFFQEVFPGKILERGSVKKRE